MAQKIIFTIIMLLIGCGSFSFGLISCGSVDNPQNQETQAQRSTAAQAAQTTQTAQRDSQAASASRGGVITSFLLPELSADKGIQKSLDGKSKQILNVWERLKTVNGVVNAANSEALSPTDNIMKKLSGMLSFFFSMIIFWKVLLALSGYMIFFAVIPICAIIAIITIWTYKDRKKVLRILIVSIIISLIIPFAIPAAFQISALMDNHILTKNVNTLVDSIDAKGRAAEGMRNVPAIRELSNGMIEDVTNYLVIVIFVYLVVPVLFLVSLFFFVRYFVKLILH